MLSAYTKEEQLNLIFSSPSSSGKSYLALEIATLFPKEDLIKLSGASPTAFLHQNSNFDEKEDAYVTDLERKIIIFKDMPHYMLLEKMRSLLAKDEKESHTLITDKTSKGQIKTKKVIIKGYPSVIFASANYKMDEQEITRSILLSPEISEEKVKEALIESLKRQSDPENYFQDLNSNPKRQSLIERILAIKDAHIESIKIGQPNFLHDEFLKRLKFLSEKDMRDFKKVTALAKTLALLNCWNRNFEESNRSITAINEDIINAFMLWDEIRISQELGLSPYLLSFYEEFIWGISECGFIPVTRQDIQKAHFKKRGKQIPEWKLRQEILPMLEIAGVISQEQEEGSKRLKIIMAIYDPGKKGI